MSIILEIIVSYTYFSEAVKHLGDELLAASHHASGVDAVPHPAAALVLGQTLGRHGRSLFLSHVAVMHVVAHILKQCIMGIKT
jgi:hypothetical protein